MDLTIKGISSETEEKLIESIKVGIERLQKMVGIDYETQTLQIMIFSDIDEFLSHTSKESSFDRAKINNIEFYECENQIYIYRNEKISDSWLGTFISYHILLEYLTKNGTCSWLNIGLAKYISNNVSVHIDDYQLFKLWYIDKIRRRDRNISADELQSDWEKHSDIAFLMFLYVMNKDHSTFFDLTNRTFENKTEWILDATLKYYDDYFQISDVKTNFDEVSTPEDLLYYMCQNIIYGYIDGNHIVHNNLKELYENYIINTVEEIKENMHGTCIEHVKLQKFFFDKKGINSKVFCYRLYNKNETKSKMHCFVLYEISNSWYSIETCNLRFGGIYKRKTFKEALENVLNNYEEKRKLTELPDIPNHLTYAEFNEYIDRLGIYEIEKMKNTRIGE